MKKKLKRIKHHSRRIKEIGLVDSPFFRGLMALIPILLILSIGILGIVDKGERELMFTVGEEPGSPLAHFKLAEVAVSNGDYDLAREEYSKGLAVGKSIDSPILGASSYLEDLIWPQRKMLREIEVLEGLKSKIVSREIHARLAWLYHQLGEDEKAEVELAAAYEIDPNDEQLKIVRSK